MKLDGCCHLLPRAYADRLAGLDTPAAEMSRLANGGMAELVARHPERFAGWVASVPLNDVDAAVAEAERVVPDGALGAQIYANVQGHVPTSRGLDLTAEDRERIYEGNLRRLTRS